MNMELRHLRYIVAVADFGGVNAAAVRLRVAQPAISRQIKDLEAELGFALLERVGRGVVVTDAGQVYVEAARDILSRVALAAESAGRIAAGTAGVVSVGLLEGASWSGMVPKTFFQFSRTHPKVRLDVVPMSSGEQIEAVLDGRLDAGFVHRQDSLDPRQLTVRTLRTDNIVFAASTEIDFGHDGPLALKDIDGLPILGYSRGAAPVYDDRLRAELIGIGFEAKVAQEVENESTMLSLVSAGVGCAFVNSAEMNRPPRHVQFRNVAGLTLPIDLVFVTRNPMGSMARLLDESIVLIK